MNAMKPLIDQLTKMVKEGYDLGKKELPDVAKQIIRYYTWVNVLQSIGSILLSLAFASWTWLLLLAINAENQSMDGRWFALFILGGVSLGFAAAAWDGITDLLRLLIAPKLFLLDTLSSYL